MSPRTRSNTMGDAHSDGVDRGVGTSNLMPGDGLVSLISKMMADLRREIKENQATMHTTQNALVGNLKELRVSQVSMNADHTSLHEKIVALEKARVSRLITSKGNHIQINTFNGECLAARGDGGYTEHVSNVYGMNGDGRYGEYKCYTGYSRKSHDRCDYESRYHDDGLDRGSRRE